MRDWARVRFRVAVQADAIEPDRGEIRRPSENRTWFFIPVPITLLSRANAAALQSARCVPPSLRYIKISGLQGR